MFRRINVKKNTNTRAHSKMKEISQNKRVWICNLGQLMELVNWDETVKEI